jgi:hypothetical protein
MPHEPVNTAIVGGIVATLMPDIKMEDTKKTGKLFDLAKQKTSMTYL